MDPNQPGQYQGQPPAPQNNDYDFIMNSQNQNKSPLFAPENTKLRIAIFATGIIFLIILMVVFFSFLNSAGNKQRENLLNAAQTQQEITRVIDLAKENISDDKLKDKVLTLRVVVISSQQDVTAALGARGQEANPKDLAKATNPQTDAELETALAEARYDDALSEILLSLINQYASQLQVIYDNGSPSEQELATEAFNQIDLVYGLSQQTDSEEAAPDTSTQ